MIGGAAFLFAGSAGAAGREWKPLAHRLLTPRMLGLAAMVGAWRLQLGNHASADVLEFAAFVRSAGVGRGLVGVGVDQ